MEENGNNKQPEHRENPNPSEEEQEETALRRTPFANMSQVDADLALARTLQEQERAYMMLSMRAGGGGSGYGGWEGGSYFYDDDDDDDEDDDDDFGDPETENDEVERSNNTNNNGNTTNNNNDSNSNSNRNNNDGDGDRNVNNSDEDEENDEVDAFDAHVHDENEEEEDSLGVEFDPAVFTSDEAYARALQDAEEREEREMAARFFALAGIHDLVGEVEVREDGADNSQDWEEVDPDELSYEELLALSEVVGTESRGLSADTIASLPSIKYKAGSSQNGRNDSCVICRLDYEDDETLTLLLCKHSYHPECLNNWLKINKVCPVCSTEVSSSGHS